VVHSAFDFNLHVPANAMLLAFVFALVAHPSDSRRTESVRDPLGIYPRWATAGIAALLLILCGRIFPGEYYMERARTALRDEDPGASILYAQKALQYDTRNPELYFYYGRALMASSREAGSTAERNGLAQAAVEAFQRAQSLAPLDSGYALSLAFAYDEIARFEDAERMYAIARSRDPRSEAVAQLYQAHLESREKVATGAPAGSL
jgi:tetratricopeptide (TPR) repeat protein